MAIALGVHTMATGNGVTSVTTTGVTTSANSTLIAVTTMGGNSGGANSYSSLSDNKSGTWTEIGTAAIHSGGAGLRMFYCKGNSGTRGSGHTITFNYNQTEYPCAFLLEITGADTSNPLDQNAQLNNDDSSPFVVGPTGTTSQANEFILTAGASDSATSWAATGFTVDDSSTNFANFWVGAIAHKIVSATGTQSASWTTGPGGGSNAFKIATFKEANADVTLALTGQSIGSSTGTLRPDNSLPVTGVLISTALGTLTPALSLSLTGQLLTLGEGTLSVTGGDQVIALTGQSIGSSQGTLTPSNTVPVAGVALTGNVGSLTASLSLALAGQGTVSALGTLVPTFSKALTGQAMSGSQHKLGGGAIEGDLGTHTLLGIYDGDSTNPAVTSNINTQTSGSTFIAFQAGYSNNNSTPTDNKSNTYTLLDSPGVYVGYSGQFDFKLYVSANGNGGTGHHVSVTKNGTPSGEIVVGFIEIVGITSVSDFTQTYASSGSTNTTGSLTTTGAATLIAIWSGDNSGTTNSATPGNSFSTIEDFTVFTPGQTSVQTVVAARNVTGAGTYSCPFSVSPNQGAVMWLLAFEHGAGGTDLLINVPMVGQGATLSQGTLTPSIPGSASLTGQSLGTSQGTMSPQSSVGLTGQGVSIGQTSPTPNTSTSITGESIASATNFLTPNVTIQLVGQQMSLAQGTLISGMTINLSGQSLAGAQTSLGAPAIDVPLAGVTLVSGQGSVSPPGETQQNLTGQSVGVSTGTLVPGASFALTGQQMTTAITAPTPSSSVSLTGIPFAVATGAVGVNVTVALTGQQMSLSQGTVTAGNDIVIQLTGLAMSIAQGQMGPAISKGLTGIQLTIAQGDLVAVGDFSPPKNFAIQYSDDGVTWITVHSESNLTWTPGETKTFNF